MASTVPQPTAHNRASRRWGDIYRHLTKSESNTGSDADPPSNQNPLGTSLDRIRKLVEEVENKLTVDLPDQSLNSLTLIAGFLVIAAFPLLTQDISSGSGYYPTHFSPQMVHCSAAISVCLFLTVIISSQVTKILFLLWEKDKQDHEGRSGDDRPKSSANKNEKHSGDSQQNASKSKNVDSSEDHKKKPDFRRVILLIILLELLTAAMFFFLLIVAAYVFVPGLVFLVLDGLFAIGCLCVIPFVLQEADEEAKDAKKSSC